MINLSMHIPSKTLSDYQLESLYPLYNHIKLTEIPFEVISFDINKYSATM